MKKILFALALSAYSLVPANADPLPVEMPKELRGVWCLVNGSYVPSGECTVRNGFGVDASGFNDVCQVLNVTQFGKHAYRIKFQCQDEDNAKPLIIDHTWRIKNGVLLVRSRR